MTRQVEERLNGKKVEVEIQTWPNLKELIKFKDLIKLLIGFNWFNKKLNWNKN